ncbi:transposase zinc-binding domain-containing protein (plasmid) [Arsenophonus nasoniae]|uniref:Transposase zinc-binding domain protein n=1 Tax=Arsenophonus nasoniae TaxID=638 RepID=A0A4P7L8X1_9GAMM|nr:transposase zinc-binding domain-containing protein [Arsenophonus nasoniae]QBY46704.1 Transposase zinc-binding domain protein [Arsenophonus nasoniae]QBY46734.1 Transposase zinc-binding domain protein [Arsenophonus nasoniae]WGM08770.1 transposase zinc-binding domain-containing protein [Arsenophonus nasoniae]WGM13498.1 transposase zinc-binding domain-containing protein [Arsenophonus nasoniae]
MYIPRPAKLLFTIDDGWNKFLEKYGDSVSSWTSLSVERMLACGTCAMGVRRYCCASSDCSHSRFFCQSCKSKACSSCGFKATEQWLAQQVHILPDCDWQHITFTMPHLLWPFFNNNWPLLNALFRAATRAMLQLARKQGIEIGIFCALHTYGRQLNQHPHVHVSVTRGGLDSKHSVNDHRKLIHFLSKSDQSKLIHCFTQLLLLSAAYLSIGSFHRLIAVHANDEVNDQA